jgi:hypothetical protein
MKYTKKRSVIRKLLRGDLMFTLGVMGVMAMVRGAGGWDATLEYVEEFIGEGRRYLGV